MDAVAVLDPGSGSPEKLDGLIKIKADTDALQDLKTGLMKTAELFVREAGENRLRSFPVF